MRLFIALDLPDFIKDELKTLHDRRMRARWTTEPQWHITLHFLGERDDEATLCSLLSAVQAEPFALRLQGVGTFSDRDRARVLWAGIEAPPALQTLHSRIGDALAAAGFEAERRPYHPHMTLARFYDAVPTPDVLHGYLERHAAFSTAAAQMNHFTLYESRQGSYTARAQFPLLEPIEDD